MDLDLTNIEIITSLLSLAAFGVSIRANIQAYRIHKREIRIGKVEEMISIIHTLYDNYAYFIKCYNLKISYMIFFDIISYDSYESYEEQDCAVRDKIEYERQQPILNKIFEKFDLENRLNRLYVLNNSYLPQNKHQAKINTLIDVYKCLINHILIEPFEKVHLDYNKFPNEEDFLQFKKEVLKDLIKEMKLGYNNNFKDI